MFSQTVNILYNSKKGKKSSCCIDKFNSQQWATHLVVQIISCSIYVLFKVSMPAVVRVRPSSCLSSPVCVVTCYSRSFSAICGMQLGQWSNNSTFRVSLRGGAHACYGCHCGWQLCKGECVTTVVSPVFADGRQGGCQRLDRVTDLLQALFCSHMMQTESRALTCIHTSQWALCSCYDPTQTG